MNMFLRLATHEETLEGMKKGKSKVTSADKISELEIMASMERRKLRLEEEDQFTVPKEIFRKI